MDESTKEVLRQIILKHGMEETMGEIVDIVMESNPDSVQELKVLESYMDIGSEKVN